MKMKLLTLLILLCLFVFSWGACTAESHWGVCASLGSCYSQESRCSTISSCMQSSSAPSGCTYSVSLPSTGYGCANNSTCSATFHFLCCDTQAEADSVACDLKPGMHWANGTCSAPVCETACSSQQASCTNWKDSVTYVVDTETGDTTFSCVGYCKTARMTHTDSVEAMDDSLSIIYRKNFADSVKVSYGENCVSPADTTGGGNPQEAVRGRDGGRKASRLGMARLRGHNPSETGECR